MALTFQIVGHKKSGKTTLLQSFLQVAKESDHSVSVIKHTHMPVAVSNDNDTGKFFELSDDVLLLNKEQTIHYQKDLNLSENQQVKNHLKTINSDFVIIEGMKELPYPKIVMLKSDETVDDYRSIKNILKFTSLSKLSTNTLREQFAKDIFKELLNDR